MNEHLGKVIRDDENDNHHEKVVTCGELLYEKEIMVVVWGYKRIVN